MTSGGHRTRTDGPRFKVTLDPLPTEALRKTAEYVRQALGKVGISVSLRLRDRITGVAALLK